MQENEIDYKEKQLEKVAKYAENIYKDKTRIGGNSVLEHALGVAINVANLKLDDSAVYAALLHEVIKFDEYKESELIKASSKEISDMVNTISKLSYFNFKHGNKVDSTVLRKMFIAIAKDIRTVIIKLADRLYNMQNIKEVDEKTAKEMAKECLDIYAPIAHRLGMSQIKTELEDISFRVLYPDDYQEIKREIDQKKAEREKYITARIDEINKALKKEKIEATVYGRPKHFYSIYKKMKMKGCRADDLFDLLAIRIIVSSVKDCYSALGIVHDMYKPMPGRFKDYIAVPKTNMYQSLHTTVFGEGGKPFEIQIRTWNMHKVAEEGIAAHFSYKEKTSKVNMADKKLLWVRKALELKDQLGEEDKEASVSKMKTELFGDEVFVFTPKGEIKSLPRGSSTIDFAYSVHQKVGEQMVGAKINSKMVPIYTKLENSDIVEIITSKTSKGPKVDWLKFVKTSSAKNKISSFLKKQGKQENIVKGKEIFEKNLRKQKYSKESLMDEELIPVMLKKFNFNTLDEAYENIGFGSISAVKLVNKLVDLFVEKNLPSLEKEKNIRTSGQSKNSSSDLVDVENITNCLVKFAKCCTPIPGDDIVGYITYSNGVSVHRKDCANLKSLDTKNRQINVKWKEQIKANFISKIKIFANSREDLISDIISKIKDEKINMLEVEAKMIDLNETVIFVSIEVSNASSLQSLIKKLKKVDSVFDVRRVK